MMAWRFGVGKYHERKEMKYGCGTSRLGYWLVMDVYICGYASLIMTISAFSIRFEAALILTRSRRYYMRQFEQLSITVGF
jgi:hypothetical protein